MLRSSAIAALVSMVVCTSALGQMFKSFEHQPAPDSPTFVFSRAKATESDPVVISIPGRKLAEADRQYRTGLQRAWLQRNAPSGLELRARLLVECGRKIEGEVPLCDLYAFEDPKTKKKHEYFVYVGNWP